MINDTFDYVSLYKNDASSPYLIILKANIGCEGESGEMFKKKNKKGREEMGHPTFSHMIPRDPDFIFWHALGPCRC